MRTLADESAVAAMIERLAAQVRESMSRGGAAAWGLVGVRSRGDVLAGRLAEKLGRGALDGRVGSLDITLYRDDLSEVGSQAIVRTTEIAFAIDGLNLILVDDVLMTGRSIRAAMQSLMDLGRPRRIWLSVLVDRGGRELPIAADHVALDLRPGRSGDVIEDSDLVEVRLRPTDDRDAILVRPHGRPANGRSA